MQKMSMIPPYYLKWTNIISTSTKFNFWGEKQYIFLNVLQVNTSFYFNLDTYIMHAYLLCILHVFFPHTFSPCLIQG